MSALPIDRDFVNLPLSTPAAPSAPVARTKPKARAVATSRVKSDQIARSMVQFGLVAFCTWAVSSLAGQVCVEKLRRDQIQAQIRTSAALRSETALQIRLNEWMEPQKIADWAVARGFVPSGNLPSPTQVTPNAPRNGGYYAFRQ